MSVDTELLRTFVAVVDCGGFAKAGVRRHMTQSTVSQQMKRLRDQVGHPLFAAAGRRRVPTTTAELLLGYARRILALHDDAALALNEGTTGGAVRIGATQDFAEARLPAVLHAFAHSHPRVRIEVRVGASRELQKLVEEASLDVAIVFDNSAHATTLLRRERAGWLAGPGFSPPRPGEPWPLSLFEPPCTFRSAALGALDASSIPWKIVYSSPSLSGILAAVRAGLAVTLRLASHAQKGLRTMGPRDGLPAIESFRLALLISPGPATPAARSLVAALRRENRSLSANAARPS
jgi:DNA-binding transcriptional LysR family regulator